jgi:hypothetical protein
VQCLIRLIQKIMLFGLSKNNSQKTFLAYLFVPPIRVSYIFFEGVGSRATGMPRL